MYFAININGIILNEDTFLSPQLEMMHDIAH